jgi:hypothetical protein
LLPESSQDWKTLQRFQKEAETRASQHRPHLRHGTRLRRHLLLLHETRRRTIPLPVIKGPS